MHSSQSINIYDIAILGAGPAGLSAAASAAKLQQSHILLEASAQLSNTIFDYPLGKDVMAEPSYLPLRSDIPFSASKREFIIKQWNDAAKEININIQYQWKVSAVEKINSCFKLIAEDGKEVLARTVLLAIGMQGNPNLLPCKGATLPNVHYRLRDPAEFEGQRVIVVGAGDSAIEAALTLSAHSMVTLINRGNNFDKAKSANRNKILAAIGSGQVLCLNHTNITDIQAIRGAIPLGVTYQSEGKSAFTQVHQIIVQIGARSPRAFMEKCGIAFESSAQDALPKLSKTYESNVKGLYILGALSGQTLIKQGLNQGYDCIHGLIGKPQKALEQELVEQKLHSLKLPVTYEKFIRLLQKYELFSTLSELKIRDILVNARITKYKSNETIFAQEHFSKSIYLVIKGKVTLQIPDAAKEFWELHQGEFFGEIGLLTGRKRQGRAIAEEKTLILELPRYLVMKLMQSETGFKNCCNQYFTLRTIAYFIAPEISLQELKKILSNTHYHQFTPGEVIYHPNDDGQLIHVVRQGSVVISDARQSIEQYHPAGSILGIEEAWYASSHTKTTKAVVYSETVSIDKSTLQSLIAQAPAVLQRVKSRAASNFEENIPLNINKNAAENFDGLLGDGLGEATDVLIIDKSLCVGCDNCEQACAATHNGHLRLNRKAGVLVGDLHIPVACRHCEHPKCMSDCPPNAIHRGDKGEIQILDSCIGCGNCAGNCPYGVIKIEKTTQHSTGHFLPALVAKIAQAVNWYEPKAEAITKPKAVKCDLCASSKVGPACVNACPTGAAKRLKTHELIPLLNHD